MRRITVTVLLLSTFVVLAGCKKQIACDPVDSQAVCKGFQDCLRSDTSAEVCRMAEQDANKIQKGTNH
jgi:uncharacterized protein YgiB involved in biofilm formation